jgi:3'-phosphoadenosine 5'-phosphosulfate sulfotransferase (PAPS reductase)/FAD synthetase
VPPNVILPGKPDLSLYHWIVVNSSAGKDSQAATGVVVEEARQLDILDRVVMVHCDLGRIEWPGTPELAREHADHYGLRFETVCRRTVGDLLAEVRRRGKWPSPTERYCTSYYKRDQVKGLHVSLGRELGRGRRARILNCLGFRAEESPRRRKMPPYQTNERCSCQTRTVHDWLPIHRWTEKTVWDYIRKEGTRHHHAYDLGMKRLSCQFCIFAPKGQLMIAGRHNPDLLAEYVQVEREINHKFRMELSLVEVQAAVEAGEEPGEDDGAWNM